MSSTQHARIEWRALNVPLCMCPQTMQEEGQQEELKEEITDAFQKLERQRLRQESLSRVDETMARWDEGDLPEKNALELKELKNAVQFLLSTGEENEARAREGGDPVWGVIGFERWGGIAWNGGLWDG